MQDCLYLIFVCVAAQFNTEYSIKSSGTKQGVSQITLEATEMGRPLYEKYGFVKMEDEMELIK